MKTEEKTEYKKYQHVEKLSSAEAQGIMQGECYIFPKIDGTNAQVWYDDEGMHYGSRTRELSLEKDNAGFMEWASTNGPLKKMCRAHPEHRFFGEWLVPHSLRTYKEDSWRKFYVFDVRVSEEGEYLRYDDYKAILDEYGVDYIAPLRVINNPTQENLVKTLDDNTFLIEEGKGRGEGVVIKNYDFVNKFGRVNWAKMVTNEFKEKHVKTMGPPVSNGSSLVEQKIVEKLLEPELVGKAYANIESREGGWSSRFTGELLGVVFYDFVRECSWDMVKKFKNPVINYKTLQRLVIQSVKEMKPELF